MSPAVIAVSGALIGPGSVELQPPTTRLELESGSVRNPTGRPTFVPAIVLPEVRNWLEVGERIRGAAEFDGGVTVWARLSEEGRVEDVRIFQGSGSEQVDQVVESVMRDVARFSPALNRDQRVPVWVQIPVILRTR